MRSLAGTRDTEIAATLWETNQMRRVGDDKVELPHGQVHAFRMTLWKEHLRHVPSKVETVIRDPGSIECSRYIQTCAQDNWETFINEAENQNIPGHLMQYPIRLVPDGIKFDVEPVTQDIPDFPGANLFGGKTSLPPVLTT